MTEQEQPTSGKRNDKVEQARQLIQEGFQSLVEEVKQGHSQRYLEYLDFTSRFHQYSVFNQLLIFFQKPDASLVAGFRKWKQLGYPVRKGERGIMIFAPVLVKRKEENEDGEETKVESLVGFKTVPVFDTSQLVKQPSDFWMNLPDNTIAQYELVCNAVLASNIGIQEVEMRGGVRGVSKGGTILLKAGLDSQNRVNTLIHEWAHEIVHRQWIKIEEAKTLPVAVRELQVESVAYVVSRYLDVESPFSRDYLLHYGNTTEILMQHMDQVQRASRYMIEKIEKANGENENSKERGRR